MSNSDDTSSPCTCSSRLPTNSCSCRPICVICRSVATGCPLSGTCRKMKSSSFEADHHAYRAECVRVEELPHRARRRLEHLVELLPAVDLLDLRVAHEVEIEH